MSDFTVTVQTLHRAARENRAAGAALDERLRRLRRDVDAVLAGGWRGATATRFDRAWDEWDASARDVLVGLDALCDLLVDAGNAYLAGDDLAASELCRAAS